MNVIQGVNALEIDLGEKTEPNQLLYRFELDGKDGLINSKGEIVLQPRYGVYHENATSTYSLIDPSSNKQVYYNSMGEKLFECPKNNCGQLKEGLTLYVETWAQRAMNK